MKIAFYTAHLCVRGTTVAIYDYAKYNQDVLGNESLILYDENNPYNDETVKEKFAKTCKVIALQGAYSLENVDRNLSEEKCDAVYVIKKGFRTDSVTPTSCKSLIHAIGMAPPSEKHGSIWAYASKWLKSACAPKEDIPVVPYMTWLPDTNENMRKELGIPKDSIVFGRTGGQDSWNIPFANHVIFESLQKRKDIYFLFQNTPVPFQHERIIHVNSTADLDFKTKFINSCDAMIHARSEGESFGLACAEFSIKNKPIITWGGSPERSHIEILGNKAHIYHTPRELYDQIINFQRLFEDYNCYDDYSPKNIMKIFKDVYLSD